MKHILSENRFGFISGKDKDFIVSFDGEINKIGYNSDEGIVNGFCWGRYMIIYKRSGVKSKKSYARIYMRDNGIALRMYFTDIDKRREFIEKAPAYIQDAFISEHGRCSHCHNQKADGSCNHRKTYTIAGKAYEKCDGFTFEFWNVEVARIPEYIKLFLEFYPLKKGT